VGVVTGRCGAGIVPAAVEEKQMDPLPVAAFLAREGVERRFKPDQSDRPDRPAVPRRPPMRHTGIAIATALQRTARAVAPAGYHPA
jgi:hypothetical protein